MSEGDPYLIETLREALERIALYVQGFAADTFLEDQRTIDAVALNLLVVGECARRLSDDIKLKTTAPWIKMVALRHRIAHGYGSVDPAILWRIANQGALDLAAELDALER